MGEVCRACWRNCASEMDDEMRRIDELEDRISPLSGGAMRVRELISCLEICHHKAERWVRNAIEAIGAGDTAKGLGTRSKGKLHPAEKVWQDACAALSAWCAGCPAGAVNLAIGDVPAGRMLEGLGKRSALKEWQVQRVIEKIGGCIHWPPAADDPSAQYVWLLIGGEGRSMYRERKCPERFAEHEDFWLATAQTTIHDTESGRPAEVPLGRAIDMVWPCHWDFVANLRLVLEAIGGNLRPGRPFAACGRNVSLSPLRGRMEVVCRTLRVFCGEAASGEVDGQILAVLGKPTDVAKWLAASLDKTIRLQLNPPENVRAMSALTGPAWIRQ